ncbi:hypothetical protein [Nonomuraea sp. B19D2]|uniref:hypothetical protein n=1 Tax=Nonomuraea sp. B19D2 TaxID=3159561 RepID=UPI0032DAD40F
MNDEAERRWPAIAVFLLIAFDIPWLRRRQTGIGHARCDVRFSRTPCRWNIMSTIMVGVTLILPAVTLWPS